jgi:hypothetical protein
MVTKLKIKSMKTKLTTLILSVLFFTAAHSQSFHIGVKGGANINKITGQSFKDEFGYGYHLGGFAEVGLGKHFSIQPEVVFNQIKQDTSSRFSDIYKNALGNVSNAKLNYVSIPILLNCKIGNMLSLQAGPQFSIIKDKSKTLLENGKSAFKEGDFSLLGGVQIKLSSFRIYGRYALGLNNLNDIDNKDKWKSQSFQIGVGLAIL